MLEVGKLYIEVVHLMGAGHSHEVFWWWDTHKRWAVRKGDWKLLKNPIDPSKKAVLGKKDSLFLVNINENPDELVNVADKYPEKVEELIREFNEWYKSVN
jgi:arylsulfatase A-like enzyme